MEFNQIRNQQPTAGNKQRLKINGITIRREEKKNKQTHEIRKEYYQKIIYKMENRSQAAITIILNSFKCEKIFVDDVFVID